MKNVTFMIVVLLILLFASESTAQLTSSSATSMLNITPAGAAITVTNVDCDVNDVIRGVTYLVIYDAAGGTSIIQPANNGETTTDLGADIAGDPGQNVLVLFSLPATLTGSSGVIPVSFGPTAGVRVEDGQLFNPNVTNTFNSGTVGTVGLRLGFTFTVPISALASDTYFGTVLTTASYTGG